MKWDLNMSDSGIIPVKRNGIEESEGGEWETNTREGLLHGYQAVEF